MANNIPNQWPDPATYDQGVVGPIQFLSGTSNASDAPPITRKPAVYLNRTTGFTWNWNVSLQSWVPVPKVYRALLTQSGTNAPVATVLENTLGGTPVWSRSGNGNYRITLAGAFPSASKVHWLAGADTANFPCQLSWQNANQLALSADSDGSLQNTPVQILVYP